MILGNAKTEPYLIELEREWAETEKTANERKGFLKKQVDDFEDFMKKRHREFWDKVEVYFTEQKRFPEWYTKDKFSIRCDHEDGIFVLQKKGEYLDAGEAFAQFMKQVIQSKEDKKDE